MEYNADLFQSITGRLFHLLHAFCALICLCVSGCYFSFSLLFSFTTDHYLHVLNCKQNCGVELASTAGREKPFEDFLPSHLNYLQFSYYNSTLPNHVTKAVFNIISLKHTLTCFELQLYIYSLHIVVNTNLNMSI